jgi:hypothetical protein
MFGFVVPGVVVVAVSPAVVADSRWAARREWAFNEHNSRPSGSGIAPMVDQICQPGVEHVIDEETSESTRADRNESGSGRNGEITRREGPPDGDPSRPVSDG